ncbi:MULTISPECIES: hypothetical protein [unclassified Pseudodesulfovibrio]|uniref:hypothetical protein n=1 Tax=unclassified Pseudodesulfovibrio TaxID=2661612 RepID=UPI000FEC02BD|nr:MULTISPECIES: hypothetical protein [unclassified Pseudodesulfovibrio]MCJ2164885.1 hypothetical protein [Pseudodesulfovibrio sp. S3-i]RWU03748.1 hypothetical protein DWB63_09830 [Pseudodesulfovibrio sp. S3]
MDFDLTQVSLTSIITVVGSTGVLSALCTHLFGMFRDWLEDRTKRARRASYAALRLAVQLETYAIECARRIEEVKTSLASNGYYGKLHGRLPKIPPYPDEIDWKSLEPSLVDEVLSFPNQLLVSNDITTFVAEDHFPDDTELATAECLLHCGYRGVQAWKIATELRKRYGLKSRNVLSDSWNMLQCLEVEEAKYHDQQRIWREWKDKNFAAPDK